MKRIKYIYPYIRGTIGIFGLVASVFSLFGLRLLKQGESADARRYLAEGIEFLSSHGQLKSALDLAQKYLDCFQTDAPRAEPWDEAARTLSLRVLNCLPLSNSMTPQWIEKLLKISRSLHGHDDSSLILEIGRYYSKG